MKIYVAQEYDILKPEPTDNLRYAAEESSNPHYTSDLKGRTTEEYYVSNSGCQTASEVYSSRYDMEPTSSGLICHLDDSVKISLEDFTLDEDLVLADETERHVWVSRKLLHKVKINAHEWCQGEEVLEIERSPTPEGKSDWGP